MLLMAGEGVDRFIGHPFATLNAADLLPPGYPANTPTFHFLPDYANIFASSVLPPVCHQDKSNSRITIGSLPRGEKRSWKHCSPSSKDCVKRIDRAINEWLNPDSEEEFDLLNEVDSLDSEEGDDNWTLLKKQMPPTFSIVEKSDDFLVLHVTQPNFRAFVHQACRYYGLESCSK